MNLSKLRKICKKATSGPWESHIYGDGKYFPHALIYPSVPTCEQSFPVLQPTGPELGSVAYQSNKENSKYIATFSPERVGLMLDVIEAATVCKKELTIINQDFSSFARVRESLTKLTDYESGEK